MLGGDDQGGQEGGGAFGNLIVYFRTHLPPGTQVGAVSNTVPQPDTKETGSQAQTLGARLCGSKSHARRAHPSGRLATGRSNRSRHTAAASKGSDFFLAVPASMLAWRACHDGLLASRDGAFGGPVPAGT
jgi:hypothetical protein